VLAIIGTISAVAVPRMMEAESRWRIEGAAQRVAADLAEARALAIASSSNVQTTFDRTGYVVRDADGAVVREIRLSGRPYDVEIPSVSFGGASTVRFNGHGAGSASGTVTLTTGGLRCRVAVEASSGAIKVEAIGIDPSKTSGGGGR
jgi:Tfp pilus assembly protein FimT